MNTGVNPSAIFTSLVLLLVSLACAFPAGMGWEGEGESSAPLPPAPTENQAVANAENFMRALASHDLEAALPYVCPTEQVQVGEAGDMEGVTISDIVCYPTGDNVRCDFTLAMAGVEEMTETSFLFEMEDDLVCEATEE